MCTASGDFNELSGILAIIMVTQVDHAENELKIITHKKKRKKNEKVFLCLFISLSFVNFIYFFLLDTTVLFLCRHHSAKLLI